MADGPDVFDVIVIDAGPVGEIVAARAVRGGLTAVLVEERLAGGECEYFACVPSKALLRPMDLAAEVDRLPGLTRGPIDVAAVLARRDTTVSPLDDSVDVSIIESFPATLVRGRGRLAGPRTVEVSTPDGSMSVLRARHAVVVATGSEPATPDIPGLREANPWTNREATRVADVPKRLIVIGGGPVSCEMSQALHALGSEETTMVIRGDRPLRQFEPFAGEMLADSLREQGINVHLHSSGVRVERPIPGGPVTVHTEDGLRVEADEVLLGLGRRAATRDIGLETVNLPADGTIDVDTSMRATGVTDGWLYAVGDVNGLNLLTHMGKYQARVCGDVIAARANGRPDDLPAHRDIADEKGAPQVIFTDPAICAAGRTEARARADGFPVRAVEFDYSSLFGAKVLADGYRGKAKIVVDEDRRVILGMTIVGPAVVDHLHAATLAVVAEIPLDRLWHAVPAFPTTSEFWLDLLQAYGL